MKATEGAPAIGQGITEPSDPGANQDVSQNPDELKIKENVPESQGEISTVTEGTSCVLTMRY